MSFGVDCGALWSGFSVDLCWLLPASFCLRGFDVRFVVLVVCFGHECCCFGWVARLVACVGGQWFVGTDVF